MQYNVSILYLPIQSVIYLFKFSLPLQTFKLLLILNTQCPETQIVVNSICTSCTGDTVPNLSKTTCVNRLKGCKPNYLNKDQTFCIENCAAEQLAGNADFICAKCEYINGLSLWSVDQCKCKQYTINPFPYCQCADGFQTMAGQCICYYIMSGNNCVTKCPLSQINLNQVCTSCPGQFANIAQTACVSDCTPDFNSADLTHCVKTPVCDVNLNFMPNQVNGVCVCKNSFVNENGVCTCKKYLSSNGKICAETCPNGEISVSNTIQCIICGSNQVANVAQTTCVDKTTCSPGFLNLAETFCIADCATESSGANAQNQCQLCESINALSVFKVSGCSCLPRATGSATSCSCNTAAGFSGPGCTCSGKISSDGAVCGASCPAAEVFLAGASQCSTCGLGLVPNVDQTACVAKTACAPGFLNLAQTFCISSCLAEFAVFNTDNQCIRCIQIDKLSQFAVDRCECGVPNCACGVNFTENINKCECAQILSVNQKICSDKCPSTEVLISGTQCSICQSDFVPNVGQNICVPKSSCSPGFLNSEQTFCVKSCAPLVGSTSFTCVQSCDPTEILTNFVCSKCQNNLVPNLQKSICVLKTGCSPNYLNVEQTFCISSCSSQNAVQNALNQCQTCSQVNILAT
ncbi:Hypothetical_protein [Hexamita inflata]|uniref:Hypothetical_protein n=1 Tax=Hexamita inflata TaxID=28002 RepID=A0AA86V226_9EUKA|nr:Hypothetical protein HINF_LOCUS60916 [Hexamita inflata]